MSRFKNLFQTVKRKTFSKKKKKKKSKNSDINRKKMLLSGKYGRKTKVKKVGR